MRITRDRLLVRLGHSGHRTEVLALAAGAELVVTGYGGRIFGPFFDGEDVLGWLPDAFASDQGLAALLASGGWNIGGQRLWLSPELDFLVGDRERFWETFAVPNTIDPGLHRIRSTGGSLSLRQQIALPELSAVIHRSITPLASHPVAGAVGLRAAAYRHRVEIASSDDGRPVVPWVIAQVSPGGTAVMPTDAECRATAMFGDPPQAIMSAQNGAIRMPITADLTFKIAVPARQAHGLLGYILPLGNEAMLQVYRFSHDREGCYHDEPPHRPGVNGLSIFVFQDDGSMGGYGELEMVGIDLGAGPDGKRRACLDIDVETFVGPAEQVDLAAIDRLGVSAR